MSNVLFRCPNTGMNVQYRIDDDAGAGANEVAAVQCLACARIHLINRATGQLTRNLKNEAR